VCATLLVWLCNLLRCRGPSGKLDLPRGAFWEPENPLFLTCLDRAVKVRDIGGCGFESIFLLCVLYTEKSQTLDHGHDTACRQKEEDAYFLNSNTRNPRAIIAGCNAFLMFKYTCEPKKIERILGASHTNDGGPSRMR
jgi:hypothetical protein